MQKDEKIPSSMSQGNHLSRYLAYVSFIINSYNGKEPFHLFLKKYFNSNKKHGARDRKLITSLCYNYFRVGCGVNSDLDFNEKILIATFLCEKNHSLILEFFKPGWNKSIHLPAEDKIGFLTNEFDIKKVVCYPRELSNEIDLFHFNLSFIAQPKLFLRIRPGFRESIIAALNAADIKFRESSPSCLSFTNSEKIDRVVDLDSEAVVQDFNSQKTLDWLKDLPAYDTRIKSVWDCCAASGGKSILAYDILGKIRLTVSDKRKGILENLKLRFKTAGIQNFEIILTDLEKPLKSAVDAFDLIIADVPCSGSGTWSRTPEQLINFDREEIEKYVKRQRKIVENTIPHLKVEGYFLYITCSVFKRENEENAAFFQEEFHLRMLNMEYLKGYEIQADTLFVALFKK